MGSEQWLRGVLYVHERVKILLAICSGGKRPHVVRVLPADVPPGKVYSLPAIVADPEVSEALEDHLDVPPGAQGLLLPAAHSPAAEVTVQGGAVERQVLGDRAFEDEDVEDWFADDFILCFQYRENAEKVLKVLHKRFGRFGLTLHPEKTRLIEFGRYAEQNARRRGEKKPATFDFLGFTHICARSRRGRFTIHVRTMRKRLRRSLTAASEWC